MSITRFELTINLTTRSPLHSGGMDVVVDPTREGLDREAVATRFARNAHEHPILTGRSVKGAVRAACTQYLAENPDPDLTPAAQASLWGDGGKKSPSGTPLRAAALTFRAVEIPQEALAGSSSGKPAGAKERQATPELPRRVGIALNRCWGSVGDGALFVHEFVPRGNALTLVITAESFDESPGKPTNNERGGSAEGNKAAPPRPATANEVRRLLALIIGLFKVGQVSFGGRQGAGWGRVSLDKNKERPWQLREFSPDTHDGLKVMLSGHSPSIAELVPVDCAGAMRTRVTLTWKSPTGILVADPGLSKQDKADLKEEREAALAQGKAFDEKPIPTVSLRDAGGEAGPLVLPGSSVRGALRTRASRIARTVLRGALGQQLAHWSEEGVHEQLAADPTLVRDLFGTTEGRGALTVLDTLAAPSTHPRTATHNAGDRWTGGVAEGGPIQRRNPRRR